MNAVQISAAGHRSRVLDAFLAIDAARAEAKQRAWLEAAKAELDRRFERLGGG